MLLLCDWLMSIIYALLYYDYDDYYIIFVIIII